MLNNSTSKNAGSGISKEADLGHDKIGKLLFNLAFPAILAQIINVLYNMVDRMYIGHIEHIGPDALTGVGVTMPVIMCISAFAALVSMGGAPRASIMMGKGRNDQAEKILGNCTSMLLIISITLTTLFLLFGRSVLLMFGASEKTIVYAWAYMEIYACGTIFVQLALGLNAFINAQGYAKIGMMTVAIGAVCNIILDPIFIFALNMGVRGAAWATIISQAVSCIWILKFLTGKKSLLKIKLQNMKLDPGIIGTCVSLGLAPFIMQFTESVLSVCFNTSLLKYGGDIAVGAMTILTSVMQFSMLPLQGLTQGAQPIISFNYGANKPERIRKIILCVLLLCIGFTTFMFLVSRFLPAAFAGIFTDNAEYIELSVWGIRAFTMMIIPLSFQYVFVDSLTALGMTSLSLFLSLFRKTTYFAATCLLPLAFTAASAFYAEPIADGTAALLSSAAFTLVYFKYLRGTGRLVQIGIGKEKAAA